MFVGILKSRSLAQAVVERLRLQERYRKGSLEETIKRLQRATRISVSREGIILVRAEDTDPRLAAEIANTSVDELSRLAAQFAPSEADLQRAFLSKQLGGAREDLETAQRALRRFREQNRRVVLQEQPLRAVQAAARLKGEIMASEVRLKGMRNFAAEMNPEVFALRWRIEEMRRQLAQMQYGDDPHQDLQVQSPDRRGPVYELARLTRDLRTQETLVELLAQQFEQAKVAESSGPPPVLLLDRALPAMRHSRPDLALNLSIAGIVSLFGGIFLAFLLEYLRNLPIRPPRT
jgi:uncharacterized protein involved in exopolysaccharide biosynthesis